MENTSKKQLFIASCVALLVTAMTFGIRAGMLNQLGIDFGLSNKELSIITSIAFFGFPLAVIIGGYFVDKIGIGNLMNLAFVSHLLGIILTVISTNFWGLFFSTLLIGIANGLVEAACNPLIASLYPEDKTTKLNHFHLWFPGGIVIGGLIVYLFSNIGLDWKWQMLTMIIPTIVYGIMMFKKSFPKTERVEQGVSDGEMWKSIFSPLFIFMFICMCGTAITELSTTQFIDVLMKNVTDNAIVLLLLITGVMAVGRGLAGPIVHKLSPSGVLLISSVLAAAGLYLLATLQGSQLYFAAIVFAIGVTYFWPTMIGFVAEYVPKSGGMGLALMGAAGMFANFLFLPYVGASFDTEIITNLPQGADILTYKSAAAETSEAIAYGKASLIAGSEVLKKIGIIPILLSVAFAGLFIFMKKKTTA